LPSSFSAPAASSIAQSSTTLIAPATTVQVHSPITTASVGVPRGAELTDKGRVDALAVAGLNAAILGLLAIALVLRIEAAFNRLQRQDELVMSTADRVNFGRLPTSMIGLAEQNEAGEQLGRRRMTTRYRHLVQRVAGPGEKLPANVIDAEMEALTILSTLTNWPPLNNCKPFGTIDEVNTWVEDVDGIVHNGALWSFLTSDHHVAAFTALQEEADAARASQPLPSRPSVLSGALAEKWDEEQLQAAERRRADLRTASTHILAAAQDVVRNAVAVLAEVRATLERRRAYEQAYPKWLRRAPGALAVVFVAGVVVPLSWTSSPRVLYVWLPATFYVGVAAYAIATSIRGTVPKR
jgi:hypothetical protein